MRALLRRSTYEDEAAAPAELVVGDLRLDAAARRAFRGSREIELSKTEFDLLELLVRNKGIVLDHSTIYDRIWHYDFGPDSKNLAVNIGYLRRKTELDGEPRIVHTVRGVGYTVRSRRAAVRLRHRGPMSPEQIVTSRPSSARRTTVVAALVNLRWKIAARRRPSRPSPRQPSA